jgi:hypothetical protein
MGTVTSYSVEKMDRSHDVDVESELGVLVGSYYVSLPREVIDNIWAHRLDQSINHGLVSHVNCLGAGLSQSLW